MSDEPTEVLTSFTVVVGLDGSVAVTVGDQPEVTRTRTATLEDIEMYASHLARQASRSIILYSLAPRPEPTPADRISEALSRRVEE